MAPARAVSVAPPCVNPAASSSNEAAQRIVAANTTRNPPLTQAQISEAAWDVGRRLLQRAIDEHAFFRF
jgi:hypothetical protein